MWFGAIGGIPTLRIVDGWSGFGNRVVTDGRIDGLDLGVLGNGALGGNLVRLIGPGSIPALADRSPATPGVPRTKPSVMVGLSARLPKPSRDRNLGTEVGRDVVAVVNVNEIDERIQIRDHQRIALSPVVWMASGFGTVGGS